MSRSYEEEDEDERGYELHELIFAESLGINLDEEHASKLLEMAAKAMYLLPEGWEVDFADTDNGKIPFFVDTNTNESHWVHPYIEDLKMVVEEKRMDIINGVDEEEEEEDDEDNDAENGEIDDSDNVAKEKLIEKEMRDEEDFMEYRAESRKSNSFFRYEEEDLKSNRDEMPRKINDVNAEDHDRFAMSIREESQANERDTGNSNEISDMKDDQISKGSPKESPYKENSSQIALSSKTSPMNLSEKSKDITPTKEKSKQATPVLSLTPKESTPIKVSPRLIDNDKQPSAGAGAAPSLSASPAVLSGQVSEKKSTPSIAKESTPEKETLPDIAKQIITPNKEIIVASKEVTPKKDLSPLLSAADAEKGTHATNTQDLHHETENIAVGTEDLPGTFSSIIPAASDQAEMTEQMLAANFNEFFALGQSMAGALKDRNLDQPEESESMEGSDEEEEEEKEEEGNKEAERQDEVLLQGVVEEEEKREEKEKEEEDEPRLMNILSDERYRQSPAVLDKAVDISEHFKSMFRAPEPQPIEPEPVPKIKASKLYKSTAHQKPSAIDNSTKAKVPATPVPGANGPACTTGAKEIISPGKDALKKRLSPNKKKKKSPLKAQGANNASAVAEKGKWTLMHAYNTFKDAERAVLIFQSLFPTQSLVDKEFPVLSKRLTEQAKLDQERKLIGSRTEGSMPSTDEPSDDSPVFRPPALLLLTDDMLKNKNTVALSLAKDPPQVRIARDLSRMQWLVECDDPSMKGIFQRKVNKKLQQLPFPVLSPITGISDVGTAANSSSDSLDNQILPSGFSPRSMISSPSSKHVAMAVPVAYPGPSIRNSASANNNSLSNARRTTREGVNSSEGGSRFSSNAGKTSVFGFREESEAELGSSKDGYGSAAAVNKSSGGMPTFRSLLARPSSLR